MLIVGGGFLVDLLVLGCCVWRCLVLVCLVVRFRFCVCGLYGSECRWFVIGWNWCGSASCFGCCIVVLTFGVV